MSTSKQEYLKRYLSGDDVKKKKVKKVKKPIQASSKARSKIVDDDIDLGMIPHDEDNYVEIGDEAPEVIGYIDDRPEELRKLEELKEGKWKTVGEDNTKLAELVSNKWGYTKSVSSHHGAKKDKSSSARRTRHSSDSDQSPPRTRTRHDSDSDQSPPKAKITQESDSDQSPARQGVRQQSDTRTRERHDSDSDQSPPRKPNQQGSDSDLSPPRKQNKQASDSDLSPTNRRESDSDLSPPRKQNRRESDSDQSPPRSRKDNGDSDSKRNSSKDKDKGRRTDVEKTLEGKKAGLQSARALREENEAFKEKERRQFEKMDNAISGRNAQTIVRDRATGKKRNLEEEEKQKAIQAEIKAKREAKYQEWGRGLKQRNQQKSKLEDDIYEMTKPLARYENDEDLDKMLREQEREGDPMLEFIKKKRSSQKTSGKEFPKYKGPMPAPNRFDIPPGYRWDGVDRSNGFEKARYARLNNKVALQDEAYKWSVEDM